MVEVAGVENAEPGTLLMIEEMRPAIVPNPLVPFPILRLPGTDRQQSRNSVRLSLYPVIFVSVANAVVRRKNSTA